MQSKARRRTRMGVRTDRICVENRFQNINKVPPGILKKFKI
jgi:hypothetical protein